MLLYVGQMDWKKNILHILEAGALLHQQGLPFTLVLAGQGADAEAIRKKADALSIGADTILTGHVSDAALLDELAQSLLLETAAGALLFLTIPGRAFGGKRIQRAEVSDSAQKKALRERLSRAAEALRRPLQTVRTAFWPRIPRKTWPA